MRRLRIGPVSTAAALMLVLAACTTSKTSEPPETTAATTPGQSGITGTVTAINGRTNTPDSPADGHILIWPTTETVPSTTASFFSRPLKAVATSGEFNVDLTPGWYLVRATEIGGLMCGEVTVEVKAGKASVLGFICQHR
jgi:hypothetical protein